MKGEDTNMVRECAVCGEEYDPSRKRKGGYIQHCDDCSEEKVEKYLGRPGLTNKDASVTILRTDLQYWKEQLERENAIGFGANLPVGNPAFEKSSED
jgi:hypothetical protein